MAITHYTEFSNKAESCIKAFMVSLMMAIPHTHITTNPRGETPHSQPIMHSMEGMASS